MKEFKESPKHSWHISSNMDFWQQKLVVGSWPQPFRVDTRYDFLSMPIQLWNATWSVPVVHVQNIAPRVQEFHTQWPKQYAKQSGLNIFFKITL